jgi:signal transduction histidine kinase
MNPLTAVSLNVEKAKSEEPETAGELSNARHYLDQAFVAAQRLEKFILAVRKQIARQGEKKEFSPEDEARLVVDILSYKARLSNVSIVFPENNTGTVTGDPIQWNQVMLNLISNAIESYDEMSKDPGERTVTIIFTENDEAILCTVVDQGAGITDKDLPKIFDPFFTTKAGQAATGMGLGLSIVKRIIEKDFHGSIEVMSARHAGTTFSIKLPK